MSIQQPNQTITEQPPKKKGRGRPRKHKKDVPKKLKKRGRKKKIEKQIFNLNNLQEIEIQSKKIEMKSIIVHLPINIKDFEEKNTEIFENDFLNYDPLMNLGEPTGFDLATGSSLLTVEHEQVENNFSEQKEEQEYQIINNGENMIKKINNIMMEFQNFNDKKFFETDICCWHCCHKFKDMPCGIPENYNNEIFHVKGVFCSFNCALTYNYNTKENENTIQERESLLYLMYKKIHNVKEVELTHAPERETLKMFGGILTIDEFRKNQNTYAMVFPPMLSIIPQLEEIKILETAKEDNLVINTDKKSKKSKKVTLTNLFRKK